jgi:RNA polymerase sigma factor (sigma-70 family)
MNDSLWLADRFEEQRPRLRSVAYRMLGSMTEADDALQESWLRVNRAGADGVGNLGGWLTTIVARVCLNMLRARNRRREEFFEEHLPDPVIAPFTENQPEEEALLADSVGLALLVVLDTLTPAERLAFVLHDMFELPFDEIAPMVERSPEATRQLASRARRRVRVAELPAADSDVTRQREVVDAFFRAARAGDFDGLVAVLDPEVVLRQDTSAKRPLRVFHGAATVAAQARATSVPGAAAIPALINGAAGAVITVHDRPFAILGFSIRNGRIVEIDAIVGRERVARVAASVLG